MIVLVRLDFFSPYFAYPLYMFHGRGLVAPAPSTLIGALASLYYAPHERSDVGNFAKKVEYAAFWVPRCYVEVENPARHFTGYFQKKQRLIALREVLAAERLNDELIRELDKYIRGVNAARLRRLGAPDSAIKRAAIASLMSPGTRREVYYAESAYALYILSGDVAHLPRHLYRLGQKETLVAATPVDVKILNGELPAKTRFYTPLEALGGDCSGGEVVYMAEKPFVSPDEAQLKPYCIPKPHSDVLITRVERGWMVVKLVGGGMALTAVVPEHAV
jgi:CRISPR/Cas system-associated protein Cas5 (RAMP superfamily)